MKLRDALLWWMIFRALSGSRALPGAPPALPPPPPPSGTDPDDERMLARGVYWYCVAPDEAREVMDWFAARTLLVDNMRLLGSNGIDCAVMLFQLNGAGYWTISGDRGVPKVAPRGMDTTLEDLIPEPTLGDFFLKKAQQTLEAIRRLDQRIQQWLDSVFPRTSP